MTGDINYDDNPDSFALLINYSGWHQSSVMIKLPRNCFIRCILLMMTLDILST